VATPETQESSIYALKIFIAISMGNKRMHESAGMRWKVHEGDREIIAIPTPCWF